MSRPALIEAAAKRVMDIRQLFEETFREVLSRAAWL
jgi:hypothetical protein